MVTLHSLGQHDPKEVQHDLFGHAMPLPLAVASCDTDGVINGVISLVRSI